MKLNKFVRIVIASIFSVSFIYFTLVLRNDITPSFNHFFYNLLIWGPFFVFVLLKIIKKGRLKVSDGLYSD